MDAVDAFTQQLGEGLRMLSPAPRFKAQADIMNFVQRKIEEQK